MFFFYVGFFINKPSCKERDHKTKSGVFIELEWDGEKPFDLDIWVKDNMGHIVSFRRPDDALIHLERDDLGTVNDTYVDQNGKTVYLKIGK